MRVRERSVVGGRRLQLVCWYDSGLAGAAPLAAPPPPAAAAAAAAAAASSLRWVWHAARGAWKDQMAVNQPLTSAVEHAEPRKLKRPPSLLPMQNVQTSRSAPHRLVAHRA